MGYLRIVPLGGLGEIGMNCMALESADGIVVVDCGITFPRDQRGVDVIHPLFDYLDERAHDVLGVVITHGHEDHIGALPYLLRKLPLPVWAPPYALGLIRERLKEFPEVPDVDLSPTSPRVRFEVGKYGFEPLRVTHSIPDSTALAIDTPAGTIIHTGDFKLEDDPLDGESSDRDRFEELGRRGVTALLSDSTNVDVAGRAGDEKSVAQALLKVVQKARHRVIVGVFPSNVYRLKTLASVAQATGRKVCLLGRSVQTHVRLANELNRLGLRNDMLVAPDRVRELPRDMVLAIASGTQGEPQSSLPRLAAGEHPKLAVESGDMVILSSRTIPGNERLIWDMICSLERRGVEVRFSGAEPELHVSGHACRDEQRQMIDWVQPRGFIPIHGTFHHLVRHAELAKAAGVRDVVVAENGETVVVEENSIQPGASVKVGRVHIDAGLEVSSDVLRERNILSEVGVVFVAMALTRGPVLAHCAVSAKGVAINGEPAEAEAQARREVEEVVRSAMSSTIEAIREGVRRAVRKVFSRGQRRPMVIVTITER